MRVRKLFIFYDYKKQITCVGADYGQTLGSEFIDLTPVNTPMSREMEGRPFYKVCLTPIEVL